VTFKLAISPRAQKYMKDLDKDDDRMIKEKDLPYTG
jgi:mRNA-degrading endonuclease RelE of RelBE toxin-antitoxin system